MAGPAPSIPLGRIAGYEVQGKLGAGGMGIVYKALDLKLNRTVALKFLSEEEVTVEDRERLLREARAASALDHPNIAAVHTVEENAEGRTFIVMGYYEGETLSDKIRHSPLQPAHAVNVAMQIAGGLQHAHTRNITHRDIKPSNVLITNDGTAKILDFGLARIHGPSASTESASLSGTLLYMSPEQVQGRPLDARTDIWALGVVLYQMLTGRVPFFTDNAASTILAILNAPPAPMPGVPDELQLIILRALSKTPESRYQNCTELICDLEKLAVDDRAPTVTVDRSELQRQIRSATHSAAGIPLVSPRRTLWLTVALCIALGVCLAGAIAFTPLRWRIFGPQEKHIVVLPFEADSKDPAGQNVADGLMERITGKLSNLDAGKQSLWIVPSSEVRRLKIEDAKSASRELGATVAVSGRVRRTEEGISLIMDVIDAKSMRLLGSASLAESLLPSTSLDEDAVQRIASILNVGMRAGAGSEGKAAASVYDAYLAGRGFLQRFDKPGNLDNAIKSFNSAVAADPQFALGFASLGEAYWDKYRYDRNSEWLKKAAEFCNRAIQLNKKLPVVYITLARIHDASGNHDLALEEFDQTLSLDPRNADAHLGRAAVYEAMGRTSDAEQELKTAIELRPEYWLGISELGAFYLRQRRSDDAMTAYRRMLELVPDSASAHNNYGAALSRYGRLPEAEIQLRKSLAIDDNNYPAYANLGILFYRQKNWVQAAVMTEKALKLNPNDYRVWGNLGIAYEQMGNAEKANAAYREELVRVEETAKLAGDDPAIQLELAVLYSKKGMHDEALRQLNAALARTPNDARTLAEAGEVYDNLGDRARAIAFVRKSLKNGWTMTRLEENPGLRNVLADPKFQKQ
jgi:serine/threonine-protein kinase